MSSLRICPTHGEYDSSTGDGMCQACIVTIRKMMMDDKTDPADPWAHRSAGMLCGSCMWFVRKRAEPNTDVKLIGRCRRHAPTMNGYPVVFMDDWCGDHKLDENKAGRDG